MGQVLGFSHCKEFGSVSSTPDSTPPCTDGGNDESDFPELQTAREWSEEEEEEEDNDLDDDEGGTSSPSLWGTPRQNSFELTFSYIAFGEGEVGGASRRRRGSGRSNRTAMSRADTMETPPRAESPHAHWDPHCFLAEDTEEEGRSVTTPPCSLTEESQLEAVPPTVGGVTPPSDGCAGGHRDPAGVSQSQQQRHHDPEESGKETTTTQQRDVNASSITTETQEWESDTQWLLEAVLELIYWRDVQWTGVVFTGTVLGLICMFQLSFITVVSTLSLAVMCFTLTVRLYYNLLHMLQRDDGVNPFQPYLDCDISFSGDSANYYMECVIVHTVSAFAQAWKVLLVSNFIHSLMVLMLAYLMTFVGTVVNLLTLLIIGVIALFSLPLFYRQHREKINRLVAGVATLLAKISAVFHRLSQGAIGPAPGGAKPKTK